jgi:two-component system, NarL family, nitrate/nitrite response regulator NarL
VGGSFYDPDMTARVLLVEPNRLVRQGIRAELSEYGADVVAEALTAGEAMKAADEHQPEVVVLDLDVTDASAACRTLAEAASVVALASRRDHTSVEAAIDCGARAYLLKDSDELDLAGTIARVLRGERVIDPRAAAAVVDARGAGEPKLSGQELKVLRLAAEGLTNPEIGARLYLSRHTVKEYLSHAMRKLEVANRIEAVRKATELGLIEGAPRAAEALVYNESGASDSSELKVAPLKLDQPR